DVCVLSHVFFLFFVFFIQAEDGIRDDLVTGVQTCALPIWGPRPSSAARARNRPASAPAPISTTVAAGFTRATARRSRSRRLTSRSEERRVGEEGRARRRVGD